MGLGAVYHNIYYSYKSDQTVGVQKERKPIKSQLRHLAALVDDFYESRLSVPNSSGVQGSRVLATYIGF